MTTLIIFSIKIRHFQAQHNHSVYMLALFNVCELLFLGQAISFGIYHEAYFSYDKIETDAKKRHTPYNIPLLKNPYFLSDLHETWSK